MMEKSKMNEENVPEEDELENISSDLYADRTEFIEKDPNHPVEDVYQYEIGEGTAGDQGSQRDVVDTGDRGLGGGNDSASIDNSNVEGPQNDEEDDDKNKNNLRIV